MTRMPLPPVILMIADTTTRAYFDIGGGGGGGARQGEDVYTSLLHALCGGFPPVKSGGGAGKPPVPAPTSLPAPVTAPPTDLNAFSLFTSGGNDADIDSLVVANRSSAGWHHGIARDGFPYLDGVMPERRSMMNPCHRQMEPDGRGGGRGQEKQEAAPLLGGRDGGGSSSTRSVPVGIMAQPPGANRSLGQQYALIHAADVVVAVSNVGRRLHRHSAAATTTPTAQPSEDPHAVAAASKWALAIKAAVASANECRAAVFPQKASANGGGAAEATRGWSNPAVVSPVTLVLVTFDDDDEGSREARELFSDGDGDGQAAATGVLHVVVPRTQCSPPAAAKGAADVSVNEGLAADPPDLRGGEPHNERGAVRRCLRCIHNRVMQGAGAPTATVTTKSNDDDADSSTLSPPDMGGAAVEESSAADGPVLLRMLVLGTLGRQRVALVRILSGTLKVGESVGFNNALDHRGVVESLRLFPSNMPVQSVYAGTICGLQLTAPSERLKPAARTSLPPCFSVGGHASPDVAPLTMYIARISLHSVFPEAEEGGGRWLNQNYALFTPTGKQAVYVVARMGNSFLIASRRPSPTESQSCLEWQPRHVGNAAGRRVMASPSRCFFATCESQLAQSTIATVEFVWSQGALLQAVCREIVIPRCRSVPSLAEAHTADATTEEDERKVEKAAAGPCSSTSYSGAAAHTSSSASSSWSYHASESEVARRIVLTADRDTTTASPSSDSALDAIVTDIALYAKEFVRSWAHRIGDDEVWHDATGKKISTMKPGATSIQQQQEIPAAGLGVPSNVARSWLNAALTAPPDQADWEPTTTGGDAVTSTSAPTTATTRAAVTGGGRESASLKGDIMRHKLLFTGLMGELLSDYGTLPLERGLAGGMFDILQSSAAPLSVMALLNRYARISHAIFAGADAAGRSCYAVVECPSLNETRLGHHTAVAPFPSSSSVASQWYQWLAFACRLTHRCAQLMPSQSESSTEGVLRSLRSHPQSYAARSFTTTGDATAHGSPTTVRLLVAFATSPKRLRIVWQGIRQSRQVATQSAATSESEEYRASATQRILALMAANRPAAVHLELSDFAKVQKLSNGRQSSSIVSSASAPAPYAWAYPRERRPGEEFLDVLIPRYIKHVMTAVSEGYDHILRSIFRDLFLLPPLSSSSPPHGGGGGAVAAAGQGASSARGGISTPAVPSSQSRAKRSFNACTELRDFVPVLQVDPSTKIAAASTLLFEQRTLSTFTPAATTIYAPKQLNEADLMRGWLEMAAGNGVTAATPLRLGNRVEVGGKTVRDVRVIYTLACGVVNRQQRRAAEAAERRGGGSDHSWSAVVKRVPLPVGPSQVTRATSSIFDDAPILGRVISFL